MATRRSGVYPFNASTLNPLTGESVHPVTQTRPDREAVPFFVKRLPAEPAYQPPEKPIKKPIGEAALTKPISTPCVRGSKTLDQLDNALPKPISTEHVLPKRKPKFPDEPITVVHLHAPPPFATTAVVLSARGNANMHETMPIPRSQEGVRQLEASLKQLQHSLEIRDGAASAVSSPKANHAAGVRSGAVTPRQQQLRSPTHEGYMSATRSSSRRSSRPGSALGSRRPSLTPAAILSDAQVPPHHCVPANPEHLPPAGKSSVVPLSNRPLSDREIRHFLGSSVELSHPVDFCDADVGKSKSYQKTVRARITHVQQEQARLEAENAYELDYQSRTSETQTPRLRSPRAANHPMDDEEQPAAGVRSGSVSPSKRRTVAWTQDHANSPPYPQLFSPQAPQGFVPARGQQEEGDPYSALYVPASLMQTSEYNPNQQDGVWQDDSAQSRVEGQEPDPHQQQPDLSSMSLHQPSSPRQHQWRAPISSSSSNPALSPRISATFRPAAGVSTYNHNKGFGLNWVPLPDPSPTALAPAPVTGAQTPTSHLAQAAVSAIQDIGQTGSRPVTVTAQLPEPRAQQMQVQQQQQQYQSPPPPSQPSQQLASPSSSRSAQIAALQSQLLQLQSELKQIHTEASSGMATPALHSGNGLLQHASLQVSPSNAAIFRELSLLNGGKPIPAQVPQPDGAGVIRATIEPPIGNSSTGFKPVSGPHTPRDSVFSEKGASGGTTDHYTSTAHHVDVTCTTSRPPAGKVSKSHVGLALLDANGAHISSAYSIAHPPAPPKRFHPGLNSLSSFEGTAMNKVMADDPEPNRRKRVEKKPFVHPDDEADIEIVSASASQAPKEYIHINSSLSLPLGGPFVYDRYEEIPQEMRKTKGPVALENKIHAHYQHSDLSSPITVKIKKAPAKKLWKI